MFAPAPLRPWLILLCALSAAPAGAAPQPADMSLDEVSQGSLLIKTATPGRYQPAPLQDTQAHIRVSGPIARTRLRQRFRNPGDQWAEAVYAFPLPQDAAVDQLRMVVGERIIQGQIKERSAARASYRQARSSGQRAALVEQQRPNLFTTAVANIPPRGEISVELEYQQELRWRDAAFSLRFPLAITPRFRPAGGPPLEHTAELGEGWALLPGEIPNAADLAAADTQSAPHNPVKLVIDLQAGFELGEVRSRYHAIVKSPTATGLSVELAQDTVPADRDFELNWSAADTADTQGAFFVESTPAGHYGLLMLMPPQHTAPQPAPRELIFVIDTSGSMGGASITQARAALDLALTRLSPQDAFNIIEFNSASRALFASPVPADAAHIATARAQVAALDAGGGTNMLPALRSAFAQGRPRAGYLRQIVFITDGAISNEAQLFSAIHAGLGDARLFTVGIGSAPNHYFMQEAAVLGRGSSTLIGQDGEVGEKMSALFRQLEQPALTDLRLDLPVAAQALPDPLPDLYVGDPISVVMRLEGEPDRAQLDGRLGERHWSMNLGLAQRREQTGLGVLWARRKITQLMRQQARGADSAQTRQQVLELALRHHLVSPFTSLVAIDTTPVREAAQALQTHALKTHLPQGLQVPATQATPAPTTPPASPVAADIATAQTLPLASGSTASLLLLFWGALSTLGGLLLRACGRRA